MSLSNPFTLSARRCCLAPSAPTRHLPEPARVDRPFVDRHRPRKAGDPRRLFRGVWMGAARVACAALLLMVLSTRMLAAQETINYASISGRVTDAQGAVAPG